MTFELKGGHVLALLLAFFGITIAVNAAFTAYAISTFSGEDVTKPYLRGLEYNRTLAERSAQTGLGWKAEIAVSRDGADALIVVRIADRNGQPLSSLAVEATLRRPTNAALDKTLALDPIGGGEYRAVARDIIAGQWDVIARAKGDGASFEAERRVVLK
jgi:nitrogen fixation protein FixH